MWASNRGGHEKTHHAGFNPRLVGFTGLARKAGSGGDLGPERTVFLRLVIAF